MNDTLGRLAEELYEGNSKAVVELTNKALVSTFHIHTTILRPEVCEIRSRV